MGIFYLAYLGSLREALGRDGERIDPPSHVLTVEDLLNWMSERGEPYRSLLSHPGRIRAAVEREHAGPGDSFFGAQDVALFPPPGATCSMPASRPPLPISAGPTTGSWRWEGAHCRTFATRLWPTRPSTTSLTLIMTPS